jgi:3-phenylpropionate/trans-cinnamate dioxygenase ferredoxin reductase component
MRDQTFVIVGAGLAGASAAAALRKSGFDGRIVLIGEEQERPYERPELSKQYLRGEKQSPKWVHADVFYDEAEIELRTGQRGTGLDPVGRTVDTTGGRLPYDRLLLAMGSRPRRLSVPGAQLDGILTLRTAADADAIKERARRAGTVAVVGGGWIGSEVAASLRQIGSDVTLVSPTYAPLEHVLGGAVAAVYRRAHEEHGVHLVLGTRVARFLGGPQVEGFVTDDGRTVRAELVVVGIGAEPRTEIAAGTALSVDGGFVVDEHLATNLPGVYAAGDVANAWYPFYGGHLRVEHWDNAKRQGRVAAANMAGASEVYDRIPYFYSDQYDLGMEYTGHGAPGDEVVFRGRPDAGEFIAFWLRDGRVTAGMNVNVWDVASAIERLIRSGTAVDRRGLADPDVPSEDLVLAA